MFKNMLKSAKINTTQYKIFIKRYSKKSYKNIRKEVMEFYCRIQKKKKKKKKQIKK